MIKPWVFEFFPEMDGTSDEVTPEAVSRYFASYLDLWARDEALGFEGIFFSEHHFGGAFGASPNILIAAVAPRTRTLRLGVMGMVTPYYLPWRIVEEVGMLDHVTGGRLEIGTAVGIPPELAAVSMSMDEARERNDEAIEILDAALRNEVISHSGKYHKFEKLRLLPRPRQMPSPPIWTTVVSVDSAQKAARRGSKICTGFNPVEKVKAVFDAYRDEAKRAGRDAGPEQVALRRRVTVAPTQSEAQDMSDAVAERLRKTLAKDPRSGIKPVLDAPPSPSTRGFQPARSFTVGADEFVSGTPAQVADQIIDQCQRVGAGHFLAVLHWGASYDEVARGHELFGKEVIPLLRRAKV